MRFLILPVCALLAGCPTPVAPKTEAPPAPSASTTSAAESKPRTPTETRAWLCECHRRSGMLGSCDDMGFDHPDPDCLRTYADCARALACLRGEPGVGPKCLPGHRTAGAIATCAKICRESSECGPDEECTPFWGSPSVCWVK